MILTCSENAWCSHNKLYGGISQQLFKAPLHAQIFITQTIFLRCSYVRLYPKLVECLQATRDFIREPIEILSAYKPRSVNLQDVEERHDRELLRFQAGQAAEIRVTGE